jgi:hypothetical protein
MHHPWSPNTAYGACAPCYQTTRKAPKEHTRQDISVTSSVHHALLKNRRGHLRRPRSTCKTPQTIEDSPAIAPQHNVRSQPPGLGSCITVQAQAALQGRTRVPCAGGIAAVVSSDGCRLSRLTKAVRRCKRGFKSPTTGTERPMTGGEHQPNQHTGQHLLSTRARTNTGWEQTANGHAIHAPLPRIEP